MSKDQSENTKDIKAAALKYAAETDNAPYIVALGKGHTAQSIISAAQENDIRIVKDPQLTHMLNKLSVGDEIPEALYEVVAELLIMISRIDSEYKEQFGLK